MSKFETLINELSWVPLPFLSDLEWAVAKAMVNNPSLQDSLPTVGHVLSDLIITQHRLDRDKVVRLANDGITDGGLCFQRNGKKYIWDGHHRYFAAQQIGKPTCQMKTFDMFDQNTLDGQDKEGMSVQDFASQLRCRVSTLLRAMDSSDRRVYEEKEVSKFQDILEGGPGSGPQPDGGSSSSGLNRNKAADDAGLKSMEKRQKAKAKAAQDRKEVKDTKDHMASHGAASKKDQEKM